jgi:hypothetical protein
MTIGRPMVDLTGQQFGRLSVLSFAGRKAGRTTWLCLCSCGERCAIRGSDLTSQHTTSCGCVLSEFCRARTGVKHPRFKHGAACGYSRSSTYFSWQAMLARCNNPTAPNFADYGGRGIRVCTRWKKFENFLADMGERPEGKTLDRKRVNENYTSSNCRWATPKEQANNRRMHLATAA